MDVDFLVFDETESFKPYTSNLFNYPYVPRKTIIENFKMNFNNLLETDQKKTTYSIFK